MKLIYFVNYNLNIKVNKSIFNKTIHTFKLEAHSIKGLTFYSCGSDHWKTPISVLQRLHLNNVPISTSPIIRFQKKNTEQSEDIYTTNR